MKYTFKYNILLKKKLNKTKGKTFLGIYNKIHDITQGDYFKVYSYKKKGLKKYVICIITIFAFGH